MGRLHIDRHPSCFHSHHSSVWGQARRETKHVLPAETHVEDCVVVEGRSWRLALVGPLGRCISSSSRWGVSHGASLRPCRPCSRGAPTPHRRTPVRIAAERLVHRFAAIVCCNVCVHLVSCGSVSLRLCVPLRAHAMPDVMCEECSTFLCRMRGALQGRIAVARFVAGVAHNLFKGLLTASWRLWDDLHLQVASASPPRTLLGGRPSRSPTGRPRGGERCRSGSIRAAGLGVVACTRVGGGGRHVAVGRTCVGPEDRRKALEAVIGPGTGDPPSGVCRSRRPRDWRCPPPRAPPQVSCGLGAPGGAAAHAEVAELLSQAVR